MSIPPFVPSELGRFEQKAKDTIALAMVLGWSVRWSTRKKSSVSLRNRKGDKVILVPTTNVNANRARAWLSQIVTHTDADDLRRLINGDIDLLTADPAVARVVAVAGTSVLMSAKEYVEEQRRAREETQHLTQTVAEAVPAREVLAFEGDDEADSLDPLLSITEVSRVPYIVNRSGTHSSSPNSSYESKAVEVVTFSDGSMVYACTQCDYVKDNARSVSVHAGNRHKGLVTPDFLIEKREDKPVTEQSQEPEPDEPQIIQPILELAQKVAARSEPKAPEVGLPLLTHHLRAAMLQSDQARDVAVTIASLDFDTRARLAHVILMGRDSEFIREAAQARIAEVEAERDAAQAKVDGLQQDWDALQDLLGRRS